MGPVSLTALATSLGLYICKTFPRRYLPVLSSLLKQTADTIDRVFIQHKLLHDDAENILIIED